MDRPTEEKFRLVPKFDKMFKTSLLEQHANEYETISSKTNIGMRNNQLTAEIDIDRFISLNKKQRSIIFELLNEIYKSLEDEYYLFNDEELPEHLSDYEDMFGISIIGV